MIKGLYTAASSMMATRDNLDIVSNNLANADTTGYKRDKGVNKSFPEMVISRIEKNEESKKLGELGTGVELDESYTDYSPGSFKHTENDLDLAIRGNGFFTVETPRGEMLTRNGNFNLNENGELVTQSGYPVLGVDRQPITAGNGVVNIEGNGGVYNNSGETGELLIVDIGENNLLEKRGENLYQLRESENGGGELQEAENYQVVQGYLEQSNVNIIEEMTKMIEVNRLYEANQKAITTMDGTLEQAANEVGRLR